MKLGFAVVYLLGEQDGWLLDLHLDQIAAHTTDVEFTIYAAANRLLPAHRDRLASRSFVQIVDLPHLAVRGAREHGAYLDRLVRVAIDDGCTHLCTLDIDSWPIAPDWFTAVRDRMDAAQLPVAAVLRAEREDHWLPHPCGTVMTAEFVRRTDPVFWPSQTEAHNESYSRFSRDVKQRFDTGIGIGYALWSHGFDWLSLTRSNEKDLHFLMAGVYGDVFFHLGATSRIKLFHEEYKDSWLRKRLPFLKRLPVVWKFFDQIEVRLLKLAPPAAHYRNQKIHDEVCVALREDPAALYRALLGRDPQPGRTAFARVTATTPPAAGERITEKITVAAA